mgnify:CR=1 FL=1
MSDYIHIGKLVAPHGVAGTVILEHALGKSITFKGVDILFIEKQAGSFIPYFIELGTAKTDTITHLQTPLFKGVEENSYAYFVHGYYASTGEHTIAQTNYILDYSSALHKDNFYGVQFHPEKSAKAGEQIIQNFLSI